MSKDYWLTCSICKHTWIGQPWDEQYPEECPECDSSEDFEVGDEYRSCEWPSPFWIVLLIPNFLIFC